MTWVVTIVRIINSYCTQYGQNSRVLLILSVIQYNAAQQCMCTQNSSKFDRNIKYCNKLSWIGTERI